MFPSWHLDDYNALSSGSAPEKLYALTPLWPYVLRFKFLPLKLLAFGGNLWLQKVVR